MTDAAAGNVDMTGWHAVDVAHHARFLVLGMLSEMELPCEDKLKVKGPVKKQRRENRQGRNATRLCGLEASQPTMCVTSESVSTETVDAPPASAAGAATATNDTLPAETPPSTPDGRNARSSEQFKWLTPQVVNDSPPFRVHATRAEVLAKEAAQRVQQRAQRAGEKAVQREAAAHEAAAKRAAEEAAKAEAQVAAAAAKDKALRRLAQRAESLPQWAQADTCDASSRPGIIIDNYVRWRWCGGKFTVNGATYGVACGLRTSPPDHLSGGCCIASIRRDTTADPCVTCIRIARQMRQHGAVAVSENPAFLHLGRACCSVENGRLQRKQPSEYASPSRNTSFCDWYGSSA